MSKGKKRKKKRKSKEKRKRKNQRGKSKRKADIKEVKRQATHSLRHELATSYADVY